MPLMDNFHVQVNATKELAKNLGCFETIYIKDVKIPYNHSTGLKDISTQQFDFLIIIDFESTCWKERTLGWRQPEIIEFPAVLLNIKTGTIEDEFQQYVTPIENSTLSEFCSTFTGIKQNQVDCGVPLGTCLLLFTYWINKIKEEKNLTFDNKVPGKKYCAFVTWSDWDLAVCLDNECKRKALKKPDILCQWIDLKATYQKFYQRRPKGLHGALSELGLQFKGREHSGLCDARNTADLAYHMVQHGAVLAITKTLLPDTITTMKNNFSVLKHTPDKGNTLGTKTIPIDRHFEKSVRKPLHDINTPLSTRSTSLYNKFNYNAKPNSLLNVTKPFRKDLSIVRSVANPQVGNITTKQLNDRCNKTPDCVHPPRTPNCKRTPPLCKCGRRTLRRFASLPGPNQGRSFYACSNGRSLGMVQSSNCGFFKWES